MKEKGSDKVLVVGADHQNTLGIIRACGMAGFSVDLIIHTTDKNETIRCSKSRYFKGNLDVVLEDETNLYNLLVSKQFDKKTPIIPTSDFAALCLDNHLDELNALYLLPSISGIQGNITKHMDKYYQHKILAEAGFKVAKTQKINLNDDSQSSTLTSFEHPIVLKPIISAYGKKSDIVVSKSFDETKKHIDDLISKGYTEILVQEFINKEYELVCFGAITPKTKSIYCGTLKKIRYYPYEGGASLSYAEYVDANDIVLPILSYLRDLGYNGLFDIELFYVNGEIFINEINFRNSGNTWAIVKRGVNAPIAWLAETINREVRTSQRLKPHGAFMNETSDLHYVIDRKIGIFKWLRDLFRVKSFNKFWIKDLRGSLAWYKKRNRD